MERFQATARQTATVVDALIVLAELDTLATREWLAMQRDTDAERARELGRFSEAVAHATDVLFNVLNVGANQLGNREFDTAIEHYRSRRTSRAAEQAGR